MNKMVIGIDPDANGHGVAMFINGSLNDLRKMMLMELMHYIMEMRRDFDVVVSMENVLTTNAVFEHNEQANKRKHAKVSNNIGRCQQSCIELLRMLNYLDVPCQLVKPSRGDWKHNKPMFERVTGWRGKSNEDTRSAAYFGFLLAGQPAKMTRVK